MKLSELKNKRILIAGFGIEGKSTLAFLRRFVPSAKVEVTDIIDNPDYLAKQNEFDLVIKSPGIRKDTIRAPYTTATNIFFANTKGMIIGITGTKGKSTTSSLIYAMLKKEGLRVHLVGNIGDPMLSYLNENDTRDDIYVCELSSYQLDDIAYSPHVAVCINFFPDHMDYHGNIENYWMAKKRIVRFSKKTDYFVYNPQVEKLRELAKQTAAQAIPFIDILPFPVKDIPLLGEHNKDNIRAAVTVAHLLQVSDSSIHSAVSSFRPLPHRLENIGTYKGITFYDDAISTTPESTIKAIESFKKVGMILVGGQDRGYDFRQLVQTIVRYNIPNVIYFPESGNKIAALLKEKNASITLFPSKNMGDAIRLCYQHTPPGTVCLLSCASPSYSLWKNFKEKGDIFQKFVKEYGSK